MRDSVRALLRGLAVLGLALSANALAQAPITLHGAVQFNDDHAFNKALVRFQELTAKYMASRSISSCTRTASWASRRTTSRT